jgi:hypothetical protein
MLAESSVFCGLVGNTFDGCFCYLTKFGNGSERGA